MLKQSVDQAEGHEEWPCNKFLNQELKQEFQLTVLKPYVTLHKESKKQDHLS